MKKPVLIVLWLSLAILLATVTRGYKLGLAPAGLNSDEAGQGYSAYSILKTGKDEFGKSFPILFRSSGDFKTPVYTYLTVPLVSIFGLTPTTVRLPSAIFGVLTVPILYLLIKKLSKRDDLALVFSTLLAISPWHILFSRTGYEANVALFFFLTGCLVFYASLKRPWLLVVCAIIFAISIPAYHSERIIVPLMIIVLFFRHKKVLLGATHLKYLVVGGIITLLISLPTISVVRTPGFSARVSDLNILSVGKSAGFSVDYNGILSPLINNKLFLASYELGSLYFSYFSPRYMFILGDTGARSAFTDISTFFVWQFPFYIYGLYLLIKKKQLSEFQFFTICFLLIAPIPAAFTRDPYSTTRALPMVVPQLVVISLGILGFWEKLKGNMFRWIALLAFGIIVIYSIAKLYSSVIILSEHYRASGWEYGWQPVAQSIKNLDQNLPVTVDSARNVGYIQLAFFLKADPFLYQKQNFEVIPSEYYTKLESSETKRIGNITLRKINWQEDLLVEQYLIGDSLAISEQQIKEHTLSLIKEVRYPDMSAAYRIVKTPGK